MSSGRSRLLYPFIRRMMKEIVVIIEVYRFCSVHTVFCPSSCRGHCGGSSVWISKQQVKYFSNILRSSNTLDKMGKQ
jgi:hypothetical protein